MASLNPDNSPHPLISDPFGDAQFIGVALETLLRPDQLIARKLLDANDFQGVIDHTDKIFTQYKEKLAEAPTIAGDLYLLRASALFNTGRLSDAELSLARGLKLTKLGEGSSPELLVIHFALLENLASIYMELSEKTAAKNIVETGLALAETHGLENASSLRQLLIYKAQLELARGEEGLANKTRERFLTLSCSAIPSKREILEVWQLGNMYYQKYQAAESTASLREAVLFAERAQLPTEITNQIRSDLALSCACNLQFREASQVGFDLIAAANSSEKPPSLIRPWTLIAVHNAMQNNLERALRFGRLARTAEKRERSSEGILTALSTINIFAEKRSENYASSDKTVHPDKVKEVLSWMADEILD